MKNMICIVCPKGCHLSVDDSDKSNLRVSGNACPRGKEYAIEELTAPKRMVTSTVVISGALHDRLPVKTAAPIPKGLIFEAVRALDGVRVSAPVKVGDVIVENVCGTGVDIIAARSM